MKSLDDDDVELLDLIARTKGDLSQPRHITGSSATQPEAVDYSPERIKRMESAAMEASAPPPVPTYPPGSPINKAMKGQTISGTAPQITSDSYHNRYPHLFGSIGEHADPLHRNAGTGKQEFRVHFQDSSHKPADTNLKYQDEIDAYTSYKVQGHFTPHPGTASSQPIKFTSGQVTAEPLTQEQNYAQPPVQAQSNIPYSSISPTRSVQHQLGHTPPEKLQPQPDQRQTTLSQIPSILEPPSSIRPPPDVSSESAGLGREELLSHLCDLADKYWNGAKSLHRNSRFQKMAHGYLNEHLQGQDESPGMAQVQEQIDRLKQENSQLRERLESLANQRAEEEDPRLKNTLHQAQKDVEILRERLQQSIEENKVLQQRLSASEGGQQTAKNTSFTGLGSGTVDSRHLEELHAENQRLQHETDTLKIRLKQYAQMQELASMLQESHKSLVQTNEHLIRELDESRERHKAEVQQLHWSYEQMKKTASFLPSMGDSTHTNGYQ
ncbi:centrosomal protein of 72 kDa-like [Lingula anatina]|uniref:Centrosomal protein of 72 kDa-like n=1 Tax=Lingula anatina TaxID=7574 RepID=A0A1S3IZ98_LINAN|nr:centrosomal protein of 72 kDa-like [Lingula anatina]|eukprot:XP_013402874.1 centrosomal protein of 72 kDa-like [Lingula anatina]